MISFINAHRSVLGGEPICGLLPIAPSTYYEVTAKRTDVDRLSARTRRDIAMKVEICRGSMRTSRPIACARSGGSATGELRHRPLHGCSAYDGHGIAGRHSRQPAKTTVSGKAAPCPLDRVNRHFHAPAPNTLWLSDFTYAATWQGFV